MLLGSIGYGCTELRVKLAHDLYRNPDFALYKGEPEGELPDTPPLLIIEIAPPDDRRRDVEQKLEEYSAWGVAHVWFVEPEMKKLYIYERGLTEAAQLELPEFHLVMTPADLFAWTGVQQRVSPWDLDPHARPDGPSSNNAWRTPAVSR